jgi:anti-sigma factor RsiW
MNCTHIEKIIPLYAGGDLGDKDETAVAAHLRSCDSCRLLAAGYRRSQELLLSYEAPEFGSAFFDGIRSAVLEEHARTTATTHLTPFQRARNFIRESLPDVRFFSPRVAGFATLLVAVALGLVLFNASTRRQAEESADAGKALPDVIATNSPRPQEQQRAALPDSSPDTKQAEPPLETGRTGTVERTLAATVRSQARRRTTQLVAQRGTVERQPKLFKDEALLPGEETYLDAISALDKVIKERHGVISSTLRAEYERNLTDVDRAIASTRKAALRHPDDPEMTDFMLAAYRGKVVLLSAVAKQSQSTASEF